MARLDTVFSAVIAVSAASMAMTYAYKTLRQPIAAVPTESGTRLVRVTDPAEIAAAGTRIGPDHAKVEVTEFSDLQCPFCKMSHETIRRVMIEHPDEIAYTFIHYPLSGHQFALPAARAAECGRRQGSFVDVVDLFFAQQDSLGRKPWARFAHEAEVPDTASFSLCLETPGEFAAIRNGMAVGQQLGVRGTPTVIINGWRFERPPAPAELERIVGLILSGELTLNVENDTLMLQME